MDGAVKSRSAVMSPRESLDGVELVEQRACRMLLAGSANFRDDARERIIRIEERRIRVSAVSLDHEPHLRDNLLRPPLSGFVEDQKIDDRGRDPRFVRIFKDNICGL